MFANFSNNLINNIQKAKSASAFKISKNIAQTVSFKGVDTFEKSSVADAQNIKDIDSAKWSKSRIRAIYDKTYDEVMEQNPLSKELNIEKPRFKLNHFENTQNGLIQFAEYSFPSNQMSISSNSLDDLFLCTAIQKDGTRFTIGIYDKNEAQKADSTAQQYGCRAELTKLNNKEKEAFLKTALAHELRHCIQMHLVASTKGCSKPFRATIVQTFKNNQRLYEQLKKLNDAAEALGEQIYDINIQPPEYSLIEYSDNFIPKKLITDDVKLKFSMSPKDNRYLSTKDHLLQYLLMIHNKFSPEIYKASPVEMDANNYAYQYFCTKIKKDPEFKDIRPEVSNEIQDCFFDAAKKAIASMKNFGLPDLIRK